MVPAPQISHLVGKMDIEWHHSNHYKCLLLLFTGAVPNAFIYEFT